MGSRVATLVDLGGALGASALVPWRLGGGLGDELSDREHLDAALTWLCRSQDVCNGRGSSAMRKLGEGWHLAYPETSGYLIATFLASARALGRSELRQRAIQLAEWEADILTAGGGVLSSPDRPQTRVFNTGQVLLGFCALAEETGRDALLAAGRRMGDYLLALQEPDGCWERDTHCGARTYHARVDWGLLRLAALTGEKRYGEAAAKNLAWVLAQAQPNGWFRNCGFHQDAPITHVIAYTLRGLLESHALHHPALEGLPLLDPVVAAAEQLERWVVRSSGLLPASFESDWTTRDRYSCLTGLAQLSVVFARLGQLEGRPRAAARTLASAAKRAQRWRPQSPDVHGALAGSHPLRARYVPFAFPNWAAKFLADALLFQLYGGDPAFNVLA